MEAEAGSTAMTIGLPGALTQLTRLAARIGADATLRRLEALALGDQETTADFLGVLVSFIATRGRLTVLASWAGDSSAADELDRLGRIAWSNPTLLLQLRWIGAEHVVATQLRNYLESHYLVTMAAARRALHENAAVVEFVEKLRLVVLLRALDAGGAGVLREANLKEVCTVLRHVSEREHHPKFAWVARLAHDLDNLADFVGETRTKALAARHTASTSSEKAFINALVRVLDRDYRALSSPKYKEAPTAQRAHRAQAGPTWPQIEFADSKASTSTFIPDALDDAQEFALVEVDAERPPAAQREAATGLMLQSLEDSQYLRHSWHHLSQAEEVALLDRCQQLLGAPDARDQLGTALVAIALMTATPVSALAGFPFREELSDDWALDLSSGTLHRRPPRFAKRWHMVSERDSEWVRGLANEWRIKVAPRALKPIQAAVGDPVAQTLGELWSEHGHDTTLEAWFGARFTSVEALERLTSPSVARVLSQQAFAASEDHVQARLVSSSPRTGLPSACTYGAFTSNEIRAVLRNSCVTALGTSPVSADRPLNAAGSEMDVLLPRLKRAIAELTASVNSAAQGAGGLVEYHNRLTALSVVALLASTGARPVTSPFESLSWIDLERRLMYVEDKHSGPSRGSRLCVLSDIACELLVQRYLPHLAALARALTEKFPKFAIEVRRIPDRDPECRLPMFFFLRSQPTLEWIEVSESQLNATVDAPWPLPWNLFRHLHSTQLRRWGLHADIRDALLSHGDHGAESHGDVSWRIPRDDLAAASELVNRLAMELGFELPAQCNAPTIATTASREPAVDASRPFGREARREQRERVRETADSKARSDLERAVNNRLPASLSPSDWDEIARRMLMRDDGLPHPMASLRYEVLEDYLSRVWRNQDTHVRLSKRWIPVREAAPLFSEAAIHAPKNLEQWRKALDELTGPGAMRKPPPALAGLLAALELALHCRVGSLAVLRAVARNSDAVRVVHYNKRLWLESSYQSDWKDGRPVYRVPITARAASWIGIVKLATKDFTTDQPLPSALRSLAGDFATSEELLRAVADAVSQSNAFDQPGVLAAVLNGRCESSALPHRDWIRSCEGAVLADDDPSASASGQAFGLELTQLEERTDDFVRSEVAAGSLLENCRILFTKVLKALTGEDADAKAKPAAYIERAIKESGFGFGDAPLAAARYAIHLLTRKKKTSNGKMLKASTRVRYWHALAPGMLDFAYDVNLTELDEVELTELYTRIVNAAKPPAPEADAASASQTPLGSRRRELQADSDAAKRVLAELEEFHDFARSAFGLEDPDWSEISPGSVASRGRPGTVLYSEYVAALQCLAATSDLTSLDDRSLSCAFVLLACARFGLRVGEAVGLQRHDWVTASDATVVLVRSNAIRSLKTRSSKRQIPLIGTWSELERAVIAEVLRRWEHAEGRDRSAPLLHAVAPTTFRFIKASVATSLLLLLKSVTRNPATMVHHLRHGYASRVLAALCQHSARGDTLDGSAGETESVRRLLLGGIHADRRTLWAVARLLGHASPAATTLKSYVHVVDAWVPKPPARDPVFPVVTARFVLNLDIGRRDAGYLAGPFNVRPNLARTEPLFARYLRYLRLRRLNHPNAATVSLVDPEQQRRLDETLNRAVGKLAPSAKRSTIEGLLSGVSDARWKALIRLASASSSVPSFQAEDWLGTIGPNRQVVLFREEHIGWAANFVASVDAKGTGIAVVQADELHDHLGARIVEHGLRPRLKRARDIAKGFQVDVAVVGSLEMTYKHRVSLIPASKDDAANPTVARPFNNTIELLVAWIVWLAAVSTTNA